MYFKRIELHGFKSFAEPVTIDFQEGITCIVGPNGSGKSNISDAIRWVLGEQSPKALRGGKMEEVIFSGTASRKPKGMAEVTLVIDNAAGFLPIDFSEVAIRRRMYRSGESEYSINNTACRLRDIRELIMDTGIGVDGYSIISQGKISEIVNSKPESRRELFEEAAGITRYKARKAESERKLESAGVNLERVNDIIAEIESRIGGLKTDSEKATEYLSLRDRYKELEINITLKNIENYQLKNEYIADELTEIQSNIEDIREEKSALDTTESANRKGNEVLETEADGFREQIMLAVSQINEITGEARLNEEKRLTFERDKKRLNEEIELLSERLTKEKEGLSGLKRAADEASKKLVSIRNNYEIYAAKLSARSESLGKLSEAIDQKKTSIYENHRVLASKESELSGIVSLRESLEMRRLQIEAELDGTLKDIAAAEKELDETSRRLRFTSEQKERLGAEYIETETLNTDFTKKEELLTTDDQKSRLLNEQLSARKKTIEEMESNYEGYNQGVKEVMKSGLTGLLGVVAELMEAPKGLELAIEIALGASLQFIVCEDEKSARSAIGFLKENKAGRLTFLPLKDMRVNQIKQDKTLTDATGSLGYAVDRISFRKELAPVFSYLLGRVLIVDTLENAVSISKRAGSGLRFVTVEGEIVNAAGVMTGGAYKNKSANLLERRAEIGVLGAKLAELENERDKIKQEIERLRKAKSVNLERMQNLDGRIRENESEHAVIERDITNYKTRIGDMTGRINKWEAELNGISRELAQAGGIIASLESEIQSIHASETSVSEEIEGIMVEYEQEKLGIDKLNEEVTEMRLEAAAAESEKQSSDRMLILVNGSIDEIQNDKDSRKAEFNEILEQEKELLSGDFDLETLIADKENEKKDLELRLSINQENRARIARVAEELTAARAALNARLEAVQNKKFETEIKKTKNDTLLDSMKEKLWEEFEISYIQAIEFKKKDFVMSSAVKESREIKNRMRELGEVNIGAIKEYESVSERYELLTSQRGDLLTAIESLKRIITDTDKTIRENFKNSFDKVVANFGEAFSMLFGGGKGELRLEDENNPLECGIEISAQPPGKKLQNMNLLSGGEKTMTAIALMFSILKAKPTPFCILDEVEAALDDSNINRFADYLKKFKEIQFALVTHQKATMEFANALYGVTMPEEGISKVLSLKLGEPEAMDFAREL